LEQYGGQLPAWDPHLLPTGQAAVSINGYLFSGALTGWRQPKPLFALNPGTRYAFRIPTLSETQAHAYYVQLALPTAGDTVTIGDLVYTWVNTLNNPQDVLIGGTINGCVANLLSAVTLDNSARTNSGILYDDGTVPNTAIAYPLPDTTLPVGLTAATAGSVVFSAVTYPYIYVGATDFGAGFNSTPVGESTSAVRSTWVFDLLAQSHVTGTYSGGSNASFDASVTGASTWMQFADPDTSVIKSPIVSDNFDRYYFSSPSVPPQYNPRTRIVAGQSPWLLGVPPPGCAPTTSVVGGGNTLVLGNTTSNGIPYNAIGNAVYLIPFTFNGDTQIQDVQWFSGANQADIPTSQFAAVIYNDNAGVPGELLNTGQLTTGVFGGGAANISSFINPTNLTNNNQYWIGFIIDVAVQIDGGPVIPNNNSATFLASFTNGPPGTAPAATLNGPGLHIIGDFLTSDVVESRAYVYTWVSTYGEEGPPSPPTLLDGWSNGVWTVGLWTPPPNDLGVLRTLKDINIYRTVPGQGGATVFFFVDTVPIGTAQYVDANPNNTVALNQQLQSTNWFPPPENLQGLTVLQNGMVAGFTTNEIWFCEPYRPHAWPPGYVLTVDYPIVGLGVTSGTLVVMTDSNPFIITGQTPGQMTQSKCAHPHSCSSRGSIISGDAAVTYMSQNGLIQVTPAGVATNTTDLWFTREKWQQLTPQKYGRSIFIASCYYCLGSVSPPGVSPADNSLAQTGFTIELDQDNTSFTIWPQPGGHRLGFNQLTSPTGFDIQNVMTDTWTGTGLLVSNGSVYYFDFTDPNPAMVPYTWRSKTYQQNVKRNYAAMRAFFSVPTNTPAQNAIENTAPASDPSWNTLQTGQYGIIRTFVDVDGTGNLTLIDAREIRESSALMRIVDGFKCEQWAWEITGRVPISNIQIATSVKELGSV
jgi:hypothetical protein